MKQTRAVKNPFESVCVFPIELLAYPSGVRRKKAKPKDGMRVFRRVQTTKYLLGIKIDQIVINSRLCRHITSH